MGQRASRSGVPQRSRLLRRKAVPSLCSVGESNALRPGVIPGRQDLRPRGSARSVLPRSVVSTRQLLLDRSTPPAPTARACSGSPGPRQGGCLRGLVPCRRCPLAEYVRRTREMASASFRGSASTCGWLSAGRPVQQQGSVGRLPCYDRPCREDCRGKTQSEHVRCAVFWDARRVATRNRLSRGWPRGCIVVAGIPIYDVTIVETKDAEGCCGRHSSGRGGR